MQNVAGWSHVPVQVLLMRDRGLTTYRLYVMAPDVTDVLSRTPRFDRRPRDGGLAGVRRTCRRARRLALRILGADTVDLGPELDSECCALAVASELYAEEGLPVTWRHRRAGGASRQIPVCAMRSALACSRRTPSRRWALRHRVSTDSRTSAPRQAFSTGRRQIVVQALGRRRQWCRRPGQRDAAGGHRR